MVVTELSTGWAVVTGCGPELGLVVVLSVFTMRSSRAVLSVIGVGGDWGVVDGEKLRWVRNDGWEWEQVVVVFGPFPERQGVRVEFVVPFE